MKRRDVLNSVSAALPPVDPLCAPMGIYDQPAAFNTNRPDDRLFPLRHGPVAPGHDEARALPWVNGQGGRYNAGLHDGPDGWPRIHGLKKIS